MNYYKIKDVQSDGYVILVSYDNAFETQIPLKSARIMYEYGSISLANPERIYAHQY